MEKGNFKKPLVILIGGTSGAGKDTVVTALINQSPNKFGRIVSTTTRPMRPNEQDGIDYHFVTQDEFKRKIDCGEVAEHTHRHNAYYGISSESVDGIHAQGKIAIKDSDHRAVIGLREHGYNVLSFYLLVSREEVEKRLHARGGTPDQIAYRLGDYDDHLATKKYFDIHIENDEFEKCVNQIANTIQANTV